jgi:hypothetical protein
VVYLPVVLISSNQNVVIMNEHLRLRLMLHQRIFSIAVFKLMSMRTHTKVPGTEAGGNKVLQSDAGPIILSAHSFVVLIQ